MIKNSSSYIRNVQTLTNYIMEKGRHHRELYDELYQKFHSLGIRQLQLIDRLLRSFKQGYIEEGDRKYLEMIDIKTVNGIFL